MGWWLVCPASGHGDLHDRIAGLTREIAERPNDGSLYLRRAQLHASHEDLAAAESDFTKAERLQAPAKALQLGRGQLLLAQGRCAEAVTQLDAFLKAEPDHVEARLARARARGQLGIFDGAAEDFTTAIARAARPEPEWYIERAQALASLKPARISEAVRGLDEGLSLLGEQVVTLILAAVDLEANAGAIDQALARLDRAAASSPRPESWHLRRADLLVRAGRRQDARQAYQQVLNFIAALPARQRQSRTTAQMSARASQALDQLAASSAP